MREVMYVAMELATGNYVYDCNIEIDR